MGKTLKIGNIELKPGVCIDVLIQGRKYKVKIETIDEYNTIIGVDPSDNPVMVRLSKIVAIRVISEDEFYGEKRNE